MEFQNQLHFIKLLARILDTNAPPKMTSVSIGFQNNENKSESESESESENETKNKYKH